MQCNLRRATAETGTGQGPGENSYGGGGKGQVFRSSPPEKLGLGSLPARVGLDGHISEGGRV